MNSIILALINTFIVSTGQILLKLGSTGKQINNITELIKLMFSPLTILAIVIYACTTVLWIFILNRSQMSTVYPIQALAFPIVLIVSSVLFKENVTLIKYLGVSLICIGVYITTR